MIANVKQKEEYMADMLEGEKIDNMNLHCDEWEGISKNELILLLLQTIHALGFNKSVLALESEAGISLEIDVVKELHESVLMGLWNKAIEDLKKLKLNSIILHACKFLVLEQKYMELLFKQNIKQALHCLREELSVSCFDEDTTTRLHRCCSFLMCGNSEDLQKRANWKFEGSRRTLWYRLQQLVPPYIIPPAKRLAVLIHQAWKLQELHCMYHNIPPSRSIFPSNCYSLLQDHECRRELLPTNCVYALDKHTDEVWNVAVSHNGKYIASSSKDKTIILWDATPPHFNLLYRWCKHKDAISYVSWSHNDEFLASASNDRSIAIWTPCNSNCIAFIEAHTESVTSICWLSDSKHLISTGFDKQMILWKIMKNTPFFQLVYKWTFSSRLQDCVVTADSACCVVAASDKTIRVVDIKSKKEVFCLSETEPVTSITASMIYKQVLVNISDQKPVIRLWDISERRIVQRYRGHKQGRFVVRSAFGGPNESFVLSGSEDSQVYIWHRYYGSLLEVLGGHAGTVNAVVWPATDFCRFMISASDDHTLIIWHTKPLKDDRSLSPDSNDVLTTIKNDNSVLNDTHEQESNNTNVDSNNNDDSTIQMHT